METSCIDAHIPWHACTYRHEAQRIARVLQIVVFVDLLRACVVSVEPHWPASFVPLLQLFDRTNVMRFRFRGPASVTYKS